MADRLRQMREEEIEKFLEKQGHLFFSVSTRKDGMAGAAAGGGENPANV
jgi:hypothetical protein